MVMSAEAIARSRAQIYQLMSDVLLHGMTAGHLKSVKTLNDLPTTAPQSVDDWKAMHYALFGLNIYPYETEFLSTDGFFGGKVTDEIARLYYEAAYTAYVDEPLDHLGSLLGFMAMVCGEEAVGHKDDVVQAVYHMRLLQRKCLNEHILCWLPMFTLAVYAQGDETFAFLVNMLLDLTLVHHHDLGEDSSRPTRVFTLPPAPNILDNDNTGFREIADYLLTPVYSGLYFSRDDIVRLSQQLDLPHSHGKRLRMFTHLMNIAIENDKLIDLLGLLQDKATDWREFYEVRIPIPRFADVWIDRLDHTLKFLQTIRDAM